MFTRMVSMPSPWIVRRNSNPSRLSREGMSSAFEQSEEFAEWWGQWEKRIQRSRAPPNKFTLSDGGQNRALAAEPRLRPLEE